VWRAGDGTPVGEPLYLAESVEDVTADGNVIVSAAGADIAVHQLALPLPICKLLSGSGSSDRQVNVPCRR
jgi:hypothetical protein